MSTIESKTTVRCDLCGAVETVVRGSTSDMAHELPSLYSHSFTAVASFTGRPDDYCAECVRYVGAAVEQAKLDRARLAASRPSDQEVK